MSYTVTKTITFCYGHRLLDYAGKCRFLHGHNARAEICLAARRLDRRGMVVDFSTITDGLGTLVKNELDHKILLHRKDRMVPVLRQMGEAHYVMAGNPTAENIAKLIFTWARKQRLPVVSVRLWETDTSFAEYRPK